MSYDEAASLGPQIVGGKGWNLGRLPRYGILVPNGGILVASAYKQFMAEPKSQSLCAELARVQSGGGVESEITDAVVFLCCQDWLSFIEEQQHINGTISMRRPAQAHMAGSE
ncbi:MAG TPA: hypothetical protein VKY19_21580 [Ktedonosporobacter sp.]|nr:hypothetical protein [Ktedonosporobacter sp.]